MPQFIYYRCPLLITPTDVSTILGGLSTDYSIDRAQRGFQRVTVPDAVGITAAQKAQILTRALARAASKEVSQADWDTLTES